MLSQKLFKLLSKIALFAIVFASLAPSISHALQANSSAAFKQEVCTASGEKITIQVLTTKGQQLATELPAQTSESKSSTGIQHHLQHCPFCANPNIDAGFAAPHVSIVAVLTAQVQQIAVISQVVLPHFSALPPPAQAPPSFI
jgi:Protein of unknown function (DUF2946)